MKTAQTDRTPLKFILVSYLLPDASGGNAAVRTDCFLKKYVLLLSETCLQLRILNWRNG
jgi:hypothetical protein